MMRDLSPHEGLPTHQTPLIAIFSSIFVMSFYFYFLIWADALVLLSLSFFFIITILFFFLLSYFLLLVFLLLPCSDTSSNNRFPIMLLLCQLTMVKSLVVNSK